MRRWRWMLGAAVVVSLLSATAAEAQVVDPTVTTPVPDPTLPPHPTAETTTTTAAPRSFLEFQAWEVAGRATVTGSVTDMTGLCPATGCALIRLQRLQGAGYVTLTAARLNLDGTFTLVARRFGPGPWRLLVTAANRDAIFDDADFVAPPEPPPTTTTVTAPPGTDAPPPTVAPPPSGGSAPPAGSGSGRRIVYSRRLMRVWLVEADGSVRLSTAVSGRFEKPAPGTYRVYSKSRYTYAIHNPAIRWEYMVRFATTAKSGGIGFHQIPLQNGRPVQSEAQLGIGGLSGGCVRMARRDILVVWDWAPVGTTVVVLP